MQLGKTNNAFNRDHAMKVSVITPTADREKFLRGCYQLLCNQHHPQWEWLVYDTSLRPTSFSDSRVTYLHDTGSLSIGEKRNRLIEKATGDVIVHFDDDDYYAPTYLETVCTHLEKASFFTLHAWFSYDLKTKQVFYWDTDQGGEIRYELSPLTGSRVREIELGSQLENQTESINLQGKKGYGFSFAYTKEVARHCPFRDIDFDEDRFFLLSAEAAGFALTTHGDQKGEVIHVIHDTNTSSEYPQYRIPHFLVRTLFPGFFTHLQHHEN